MRFTFLVFFLFLVSTLNAQSKPIAINSTPAAKYRGSNPNIRKFVAKDVWTKQRGRELPKIHFDNWTGYSINLYVDSVYKGTIAAWGKASVYIFEGERLLYLQSVGGTREWRQTVRVPMEHNTIKLQ
ncbi:MAG: hypothetical protein EOO15_22635 [Chitinophagaceae bacterium]|nr:MAG: hypothetical protein EOO15_22635 [Chitinophagaceae bacterium]